MDEKTVDSYNRIAKAYDDQTVDFWERFPRTFIDKFTAATHGKILDVGSGPGRDGLILKNLGFEVICLDASAEMVKLSTERGLESVVGDFNALPFADKTFDGVWSYTALLHIPKAEVAKPFEEIKRVLKDSGIFALGLIEGSTELYRESAGLNNPRWFSFYTKEEVEQLLAQHGFEILYFEQFMVGEKGYLNFISRKK